PKAGGYALAKQDGKDVAGIGGTQNPNGPSAWMVYIGTKDADALAKKVEAAGGKVIAPPFAVLKSGRMAVFQDPSGAFISAWEPNEVPSYWMVYFGAIDVDKTHKKAVDLGGQEMLPPADFPGGRFSILTDPQGAAFGILSTDPNQR